jgi:membrane associated rhomboid family serine protease
MPKAGRFDTDPGQFVNGRKTLFWLMPFVQPNTARAATLRSLWVPDGNDPDHAAASKRIEDRLNVPNSECCASRYPPFITWTLIAANCVVFFIEISMSPAELDWFLYRFALIPARYFTPSWDSSLPIADYIPFVTNMFLHGGGCI